MASINGANYPSATVFNTADSVGLRYSGSADNLGEDRFRYSDGGDRYNLTGALSQVLTPVSGDIAPAGNTQGVLPPAGTDSRTGTLDSFLRSPIREATAPAVYGPFTRTAASIRGDSLTTPAAATPKTGISERSKAAGIDMYRNLFASTRKNIDTFA